MKIGGKKPGVGTENLINKAGGGNGQAKKPEAKNQISSGDNVNISSKAKDLGRIKQMLGSVPDVRGEMVVKLKTDIESGHYHVDSEKVAERMIQRAVQDAVYTKK